MNDIQENLRNLGFAIKEMIPELSNDKVIKSNHVQYITTKFEYNGSAEWEIHEVEKIDENFIDFKISSLINESNELREAKKSVEEFIRSYIGKSNSIKTAVENHSSISQLSNSFLQGFVKKVIKTILEFTDDRLKLVDIKRVDVRIEKLINCSLKELEGKPLKFELTLNLTGIVLISKKIVVNKNIEIRMPEKEDCDIKFIADLFSNNQPCSLSAILIIRSYEEIGKLFDIDYYVKYYLAILRLFKKGNVNCVGYDFKTESILNGKFSQFSYLSQNQNKLNTTLELSLDSYVVNNYLINPLKSFMNSSIDFNNLFSDEFFHLKIAYDHYCNALLTYNSNFEKRIVETIIGFEALFMKKGDKAGGSYKVTMTISRLFDSLVMYETKKKRKVLNDYYDPKNVSNRINDGFRVRNKYAHGEHISQDMLNEFTTKYGGIEELLNHLLDYLRISIILMTFNNKNDLLDLITDSLIKNECNKELTNAFSKANSFILLNNVKKIGIQSIDLSNQ